MRHVRLGRTGLRVSRLCLGTMTFGLQCDEPTSVAILDRAAAGGDHLPRHLRRLPARRAARRRSAAPRRSSGAGSGARRRDFVVATKCFGAMSSRPWDRGNSRKHVLDAIDGSLRRLQTDYVDLYQLHHPDPGDADRGDAARARRRRAGGQGALRRLSPTSSPTRSRARSARARRSRRGALRLRPAALQPALPPDRARAAAPLRRGGPGRDPVQPARRRAAHRQAPPGSRPRRGDALHARQRRGPRYQERYWHEREFATVEALRPLAARAGLSMVQLAVAWVLAHPAVTAPIIGASRPEQLDDAARRGGQAPRWRAQGRARRRSRASTAGATTPADRPTRRPTRGASRRCETSPIASTVCVTPRRFRRAGS